MFIVDAPGGGGKIPVGPNYQMSMSDHKIILRNFEGFITSYEEPLDYNPADAAKPIIKRLEAGQSGLSGLLEGEQLFIKPENFDEIHDRGGLQHRLKDSQKWVPLGIGSGEEEDQSEPDPEEQSEPDPE